MEKFKNKTFSIKIDLEKAKFNEKVKFENSKIEIYFPFKPYPAQKNIWK